MIIKKRNWAKGFKYNPLSYKQIHRIKPNTQPHGRSCDCKGCQAYLLLIKQLNPARYEMLTDDSTGFIRKKPLPEHVWKRRRQAYSIGTWRG